MQPPELDIPTRAFLALRDIFFDETGAAVVFSAELTGNLQGDWLDTHITAELRHRLGPEGYEVEKSGKNTSPDLAVFRTDLLNATSRPGKGRPGPTLGKEAALSLSNVCAFEVKKLERVAASGKASRTGESDYNSTPPCGQVFVYDSKGKAAFTVRGFYVFLIVNPSSTTTDGFEASALVVCDGDAINADHDLYRRIVDPRAKELRLGSYGDGAIRSRPFVLFPHPLSVGWLDYAATLIHPSAELPEAGGLCRVSTIVRRAGNDESGPERRFYCYRTADDAPRFAGPAEAINPFYAVSEDARQDGRRGKLKLKLVPEPQAVEVVDDEEDPGLGL